MVTEMVESKGEAKRLIKQGGVKINEEKVEHAGIEVEIDASKEVLLQVGKLRFLNVKGN